MLLDLRVGLTAYDSILFFRIVSLPAQTIQTIFKIPIQHFFFQIQHKIMINIALTLVYFIFILVTDNNSPLSKICLLEHGGIPLCQRTWILFRNLENDP